MKKTIICSIFLLFTGPWVIGQRQAGQIRAGSISVHFEWAGSGPALLLIHGGFLDTRMWDGQLPAFSKKYKVIMLDLPGHGLTKGNDTSLLVQDLLRICLDSLHIRKTSIIGLSLGAACVTDFVLAYPERIEKVVLVSSGLSGWADVLTMDSLSRHSLLRMDTVEAGKNKDSIAACFTSIWCIGPFRSANAVSESARSYVLNTTRRDLESHGDRGGWPKFAHPAAAKNIHTIHKKLLLIVGDKDVPFIDAVAAWIHGQVNGSALIILPNAAHMLNLEFPHLFNKIVLDFLQGKGYNK